jgi:hypothetical protein
VTQEWARRRSELSLAVRGDAMRASAARLIFQAALIQLSLGATVGAAEKK